MELFNALIDAIFVSLPARLLLAILLVSGAAALAWWFARAVQRSTRWARAEQAVFDHVGGWRSARFVAVCEDVSALGSSTLVTLFGAAGAVGLAVAGRAGDAVLLAASALLPGVLGRGFKRLIARERPGDPGTVFFGSSMPSNHTLMAGALWGSAALMAGDASLPSSLAALLLAAAVGLTRVLLRVHYPSDVLVGWWLAMGWVGAVAWVRG